MRRRTYFKEQIQPLDHYYNGWQHDMPEPDWDKVALTFPVGCQLIRDKDGNWYCNTGYRSKVYQKYDKNLKLLATLTAGSPSNGKQNRSTPYIISNFKNTGKDVIVFTSVGNLSTWYPDLINLDNFTLNNSFGTDTFNVIIPTGTFTDAAGLINDDINYQLVGNWYSGSSVFESKGKSLISVAASGGILLKNNFTEFSGKKFGSSMNRVFGYIACDNHYFVSISSNGSYNICVYDWNILLETDSLDTAFLRQFNYDSSYDYWGWDTFYIYKNHLILVNFSGRGGVYDLETGLLTYNLTNPAATDQGCFFWKNKIYRTGTKQVTELPI